jgi:LytS/YehU family sensor histidine kinase
LILGRIKKRLAFSPYYYYYYHRNKIEPNQLRRSILEADRAVVVDLVATTVVEEMGVNAVVQDRKQRLVEGGAKTDVGVGNRSHIRAGNCILSFEHRNVMELGSIVTPFHTT